MAIKISIRGQPAPVALHLREQRSIHIQLNQGGGEFIPPYTGAYEVTPTPDGETLYTTGKRMTNDVSVNGIPYLDMAGSSGGRIVTIG